MRYQESEGKCNVVILSDNKTLKRRTLQAVLLIRCIQIYNLKFSNTLYLSFHSLVISCLTWAHLFQQCMLPFFLCFFYARKDIQHLFFTLCTFKITCSEQTLSVLANGNPNIFIFISFFPWGSSNLSQPPLVFIGKTSVQLFVGGLVTIVTNVYPKQVLFLSSSGVFCQST